MKVIREGGLSRLWQHTKDGDTFAIIGSQDKDTRENRYGELIELIRKASGKYHIGYKHIKGTYTYDDGSLGVEDSIIIFGIPKQVALDISKNINQQSIVWKDDKFFGLMSPQGKEISRFTNDAKNMNLNSDEIREFASKLAHSRNDNAQKPFAFKFECYVPDYIGSSIMHMGDKNNTFHMELLDEGRIDEFKERGNNHQTHIEDLVLLGSDGLDELNDKIEKMMGRLEGQDTDTNLTTKIDGAPAVVCWSKFEDYPDNSICLKSFLTSNKNCISSYDDIEAKYGDRPDMATKLRYCLELAHCIPQGEAWQGDCLYSSADLKQAEIKGTEYLTFHPNKIVYAFSEDNPSYEEIKSSQFGICFHTIYKGNLEHKTQSFSVDATRLTDVPDGIYVMSPSLNVPQDSSLYNIDEVKKEYWELKSLEDKLRVPEYEELCNNSKIMGFWNTFENHAISDNKTTKINPETFYDEFKEWVKSKVPQNKNFEKNLNTYYEFIDNNKELIYDMVACLNKAVDIKMNLWGGLKQAKQDYSTFYKHREQGYIPASMEGVAYSDADGNIVKIVDRSSFSNVNRDSNYMSGFEH